MVRLNLICCTLLANGLFFLGQGFALAFSPSVSSIRSNGVALFATETSQQLQSSVDQLKKVLAREYVSFFNPMEKQYYSSDVTFQDPLTSLAGIDKYQDNVDMLSGRTLLGSILFSDASINLHSVKGGDISVDSQGTTQISDIVTRWTLRFCFKALPWKPTARFSGISVYQVRTGGSEGVQIVQQNDYWDSINLQSDGTYRAVDKSVGLSDFLDQLKPSDINAPSAGPELPFELLRRGNGYEVRRYPQYSAAKLAYERRDEGYSILGSFCKGLQPMAPAILTVDSQKDQKSMMWPLTFARPGQTFEVPPTNNREGRGVEMVVMPSSVVAVARFSDASVEPVVRKATNLLRNACERDGLKLTRSEALQFCQYDAIFSMGKRRGEVWIPLDDDNPWNQSADTLK
ncbi:hypothetical protein FisN_8Hh183 [Fistulifera solaris]|uniref:Uncharacterized protein n=1 Tax=Fistulifera solaris TaxID=1519565 RepID=A0A1Z5JY54_FISSO|nr:hypothetical protein FisN_8Hh183 [Fistulifera solaris]|eukprot:GAX18963.1 hypothetical protein FisN_8Hh183 [Fistulifera solaris]